MPPSRPTPRSRPPPRTDAAATGCPAAAPPAQSGAPVELRLHVRTGNEADMLGDRLPGLLALPTRASPSRLRASRRRTTSPRSRRSSPAASLATSSGRSSMTAGRRSSSPAASSWPLDDLIAADKFDMTQYYHTAVKAVKVFDEQGCRAAVQAPAVLDRALLQPERVHRRQGHAAHPGHHPGRVRQDRQADDQDGRRPADAVRVPATAGGHRERRLRDAGGDYPRVRR